MLGLGTLLALGAAGTGMNAAAGNISHAVNSISDYYFGGKSEKRSNSRSQAMTAKQMINEALLQKNFYVPLQQSLYDWQSQYDYRMAQQYAQNSASWQVEGLRKAGLNPILAATDGNFRSTYGDGGSMPVVSGSGSTMSSKGGHWASPSSAVDFTSSMANLSSAQSTFQNAETASALRPYQVDTAKNQAFNTYAQGDITLATAEKIRAEADAVRANTARTLVDMDNKVDTGDIHSWPSLTAALIRAYIPDLRTYRVRGLVHEAVGSSFDQHSAKQPTLDSLREDYFKDGLKPVEGGITIPSDTPKQSPTSKRSEPSKKNRLHHLYTR